MQLPNWASVSLQAGNILVKAIAFRQNLAQAAWTIDDKQMMMMVIFT
jgi:hypothetical protein